MIYLPGYSGLRRAPAPVARSTVKWALGSVLHPKEGVDASQESFEAFLHCRYWRIRQTNGSAVLARYVDASSKFINGVSSSEKSDFESGIITCILSGWRLELGSKLSSLLEAISSSLKLPSPGIILTCLEVP
ncbi:hypothetical protein EVAR_97031_1 [Eumeta japonica]|uniref:Uncharacterized protein n=1 Tax=Eumeta variegata TaxID=151549 RepID=A0A4C1WNR7_EUMVA|nr:hypothetical protein EVAR_97031_1 [Eumeta japonica]